MNPYEPTFELSVRRSPEIRRRRNPAKRYLLVAAILCGLGLLATLPIGPPRIVFQQAVSCLTFAFFLASSLILALSHFGNVNRVCTVIWAVGGAAAIIFVITFVDPVDSLSSRNLPGLGIILSILALLFNIARLTAFAKPVRDVMAEIRIGAPETIR